MDLDKKDIKLFMLLDGEIDLSGLVEVHVHRPRYLIIKKKKKPQAKWSWILDDLTSNSQISPQVKAFTSSIHTSTYFRVGREECLTLSHIAHINRPSLVNN